MSVTTTGAKLGLGATVSRETSSGSGVYAKVGDCTDIPEIGEERPLVDVTPSDAASRIYIGGIQDGMEVTLPFNYDSTNTQQGNLIADCKANSTVNLQVSVPAASTKTLTFAFVCLKWGLLPKKDGAQVLSIKGKISGGVTGPA